MIVTTSTFISVVIIVLTVLLLIPFYLVASRISISLKELKRLEHDKKIIQNEINNLKEDQYKFNADIQGLLGNINTLKKSEENLLNSLNNQKEMSEKAFDSYYSMLENQYDKAEEEYYSEKSALEEAYSNLQFKLMNEIDGVRAELDKIRATRAAAIQAQIKENEIAEKSTFYCLSIPELELKDVAILETIKPKLNNQRILSMLIWQTFYRTPMTDLCNRVVGKEVKTGIYKITNQLTKECYIGQAVDIASRWKDHAKCGLGIDTPAKNKLYKAMIEYGITNFSWEILEECERANLDEKEKFFIELYQSKEFGYNSQAGNN